MTLTDPFQEFYDKFSKVLIPHEKYEKLLNNQIALLTKGLKDLSADHPPHLSSTRCKHLNLVLGPGYSRKKGKEHKASLRKDIQLAQELKEQYVKLREKGVTTFPILYDNMIAQSAKEFYDAYLNYLEVNDAPIEGTLQPIVDAHTAFKEAQVKFDKEYTRIFGKMKF